MMKEKTMQEELVSSHIELMEMKAKLKGNLQAYKELAESNLEDWEKYPDFREDNEARQIKYEAIVEFIEETFQYDI